MENEEEDEGYDEEIVADDYFPGEIDLDEDLESDSDEMIIDYGHGRQRR